MESISAVELMDDIDMTSTIVKTTSTSPVDGWCTWRSTFRMGYEVTYVTAGTSPMRSLVGSQLDGDYERLSDDVWTTRSAAEMSIEMHRIARQIHGS